MNDNLYNTYMGNCQYIQEQVLPLVEEYPHLYADHLQLALIHISEEIGQKLPITIQMLESIESEKVFIAATSLFNHFTKQPLTVEDSGINRRERFFRTEPIEYLILVLTASVILGYRDSANHTVLHASQSLLIRNARYLLENGFEPSKHPSMLIIPIERININKLKESGKRLPQKMDTETIKNSIKLLNSYGIDVKKPSIWQYISRTINRNSTEEIRRIIERLEENFPSGAWKIHSDIIAAADKAIAQAPILDELLETKSWRESNIELAITPIEKIKNNLKLLKTNFPDNWNYCIFLNALMTKPETLETNIRLVKKCKLLPGEWNPKILAMSSQKLAKNIYTLLMYYTGESTTNLTLKGYTEDSIKIMIEGGNIPEQIISFIKLRPAALCDIDALQKEKPHNISLTAKRGGKLNKRIDLDDPYSNGGWD